MAKGKKIIQLYHSSQNIIYKPEEVINSIFKNGFNIGSACNKGYGVYLASHSMYSFRWGGCHTFIADVIVECDQDKNKEKEKEKPFDIERFISEIYSPCNNSEYVISNPKLIYPRYYLEYEVKPIEKYDPKTKVWTNACCPNCPPEKKQNGPEFYRCDCPQYPTIDPTDLIYSKL